MWHLIQHFLHDEIFHLQGNLSVQVRACATQQLHYVLTLSDQRCTYLLLTMYIIPSQLTCNFSQSYHSQHLFCEVLLSPDTEGRMSDRF